MSKCKWGKEQLCTDQIQWHPSETKCKKFACQAICEKTGRQCRNQGVVLAKRAGLVISLVGCCLVCRHHETIVNKQLRDQGQSAIRYAVQQFGPSILKWMVGADDDDHENLEAMYPPPEDPDEEEAPDVSVLADNLYRSAERKLSRKKKPSFKYWGLG